MASKSTKASRQCVTSYGADARLVEFEGQDPTNSTVPEETRTDGQGEDTKAASERKGCCTIQAESCALLDFATALLFTGYSVFLIWLLAHCKGNLYYHLLNIVPFLFIILCSVFPWCYDKRVSLYFRQLRMIGVVAVLMCTFTMLTRVAFYHLEHKQTVGTNFVIVTLKASIGVFLWVMLARKRFSLIAIKADKHIIVQVILDNVDIFNLVETLSQEIVLGKLIVEGTPQEKAIQVFCTLAFVVLWIQAAALGTAVDELANLFQLAVESSNQSIYNIVVQLMSLLFHNIPFLVIRIIVWVKYDMYNIGFIAKNVMAIIFCVGEIRYSALTGYDPQIQS